MSYTTGIPIPGQSLGNSRPQVNGNFDYINTAFAINHVAFNASGVGKHKFLQMPEQVSAPVTLSSEGALYTKESLSITNLFWRQESNGTEIQMTNVAPTNANIGASFLPGGLVIQWGFVTLSNTSSPTANVVLPVQLSVNGSSVGIFPWSVVVSLGNAPGSGIPVAGVENASLTSTGFTISGNISAANYIVYWIAIGPKT